MREGDPRVADVRDLVEFAHHKITLHLRRHRRRARRHHPPFPIAVAFDLGVHVSVEFTVIETLDFAVDLTFDLPVVAAVTIVKPVLVAVLQSVGGRRMREAEDEE